jgi:hypothetical protein
VATPTYTPLATITLGSSASSVTFSSIPATYRDLVVVADYTGSAAAEVFDIALNSDTAANYTRVVMYADSTTAASFSQTSRGVASIYGTNKMTMLLNLMDYTATDKHKTILVRTTNAGQSEVAAIASRWANTAAVNTLALSARSGTLSSGSTFSLYGIAA